MAIGKLTPKSYQMEMIGRVPLFTRLIKVHLVLMIIVITSHETGYAQDDHVCPPSSCGNLDNISHPFRLSGDPKNCGDPRYELSCENNLTVLYLRTREFYLSSICRNYIQHFHVVGQFLPSTMFQNLYPDNSPYPWGYIRCHLNSSFQYKSYVQEINYNNYTIRLVDPYVVHKDNCSSFLSAYPLTKDDLLLDARFETEIRFSLAGEDRNLSNKFQTNVHQLTDTLKFLSCEKPANNSHLQNYTDTSPPCMSINNSSPLFQSRRQYSYVVVNNNFSFSDLEESCRVDRMTLISKKKNTSSFEDIRGEIVYGFELSWVQSYRPTHAGRDCLCYVNKDSNRVHCPSICFRPPPGFLCRLQYVEIFLKNIRVLYEILAAPRMLCIILVVALLIYKWKRRHLSEYNGIEEFLQSQNNLMPIRYSYWEIRIMTKGFKDKLGEGGFGSVYKGTLSSGRLVAVKMLGKSKTNGQDFMNEVGTIGRIHHVNVVRLIGFCVKGSKRALMYDFMPNGSLDKYIFSKEATNKSLTHKKIFEISLGVARGIDYLHKGCDMQILHFDIKPHNILLDENFIAKVSDFGLARLCPLDNSIVSLTAARGTIGYIAPELFYKNIGGVSHKADVYSFGMLLMEMANKRKNLNADADAENSSQIYLPLWIYDQFSKGMDIEIEDVTEEELKIVKKMIIVALWCIQLKPCDRPSMSKAIEMLEDEVDQLQMPPKPCLYPKEQDNQNVEGAMEEPCSSALSEEDSAEISLISNSY